MKNIWKLISNCVIGGENEIQRINGKIRGQFFTNTGEFREM